MNNNNLLYYPNPSLFQTCIQVADFNEELHKELDLMKQIMNDNRGIGLASNQIGLNKRMFIMQEQSSNNIIEFINPEIVEQAQTLTNGLEACLSYPGVSLGIPRPSEVTVKAFNRMGEAFTVALEGIEARCAAHEIEHLDGKDFLSKANRQQRRAALRRLEKSVR